MGDFTYLRCWEGKLYFSFVIDVFSRRIVGWQLASHMRTDLVLDALRMALGTRQPGADFTLVTHTDQGSQYTSYDCTQVIDDHRVLASVGSVGDAYDNAMAESFVDSFKTELIKDRVWRTRTQLELAILEYVDWFNNRRLHKSLDDIPPVEFETNWAAAAATTTISADPSVAVTSARPSEPLTTRRPHPDRVATGVLARSQVESDAECAAENGSWEEPGPRQDRTQPPSRRQLPAGLSDTRIRPPPTNGNQPKQSPSNPVRLK